MLFQGCISRAQGTWTAADGIGDVMRSVPWDGLARDPVMAAHDRCTVNGEQVTPQLLLACLLSMLNVAANLRAAASAL